MTDTRQPGAKKPTMWIVLVLVVLAIGAVVYFVGRNQTDDNLVPSATAVDPRSGNLSAQGVAAEPTAGNDGSGAAGLPPVGGVAPGASGDALVPTDQNAEAPTPGMPMPAAAPPAQ